MSGCIELGTRFARALGLPEAQQETLLDALALYDVGRVGVLDAIWEKAGPLSAEERISVESHPVLGASIAASHLRTAALAPAILHHHERFDGTGYPHGLQGADIPILARIIHVVDAYLAMTQDRPYRRALTADAASEELRRGAGTQFDPDLVRAFASL